MQRQYEEQNEFYWVNSVMNLKELLKLIIESIFRNRYDMFKEYNDNYEDGLPLVNKYNGKGFNSNYMDDCDLNLKRCDEYFKLMCVSKKFKKITIQLFKEHFYYYYQKSDIILRKLTEIKKVYINKYSLIILIIIFFFKQYINNLFF